MLHSWHCSTRKNICQCFVCSKHIFSCKFYNCFQNRIRRNSHKSIYLKTDSRPRTNLALDNYLVATDTATKYQGRTPDILVQPLYLPAGQGGPLDDQPRMVTEADAIQEATSSTLNWSNNWSNKHLFTLGVSDSSLCRACMEEEETATHIIIACPGVAG